jgi:hypothetical protein
VCVYLAGEPKREIGQGSIKLYKKDLIFFFAFPGSRGKFGEQSLRVRAGKTFFFGITVFLYHNKNPGIFVRGSLNLGIQFYVS